MVALFVGVCARVLRDATADTFTLFHTEGNRSLTSTLSKSVPTLKAVVTTMEWKTVAESATFSIR